MRAPSALAKLLRLCDGNVAMTFALSMPIVVGGAGIVVDNGVWKFQRTTLQDVADQAALAGAAVLNDTNHATAAARQAAAVAAANDVVFAQRPDLTPTIQAGADHRSISVSLSEKGIVSFAGVFGLERVDIPVTGHAVVDRAAGAACLLALNEGGQTTGVAEVLLAAQDCPAPLPPGHRIAVSLDVAEGTQPTSPWPGVSKRSR